MPIRPEQKALYPKNWKEIRASILERAGDKCEECGVANKRTGYRQDEKFFGCLDCMNECDSKCITIVLTIAHLDHDPTHNDPANLKALCQRCHLRYDHKLHMKNSRNTREKKKGLVNLFE